MPTEAIVIDPAKLGELQKVLRKAKRCIRDWKSLPNPNITFGDTPTWHRWQATLELGDEVLAEANALGVPDNGD